MICGPNLKRTKLIIGYTTMTVTIELCVYVFFKITNHPFQAQQELFPYVLTADLQQCDFGWIRIQIQDKKPSQKQKKSSRNFIF